MATKFERLYNDISEELNEIIDINKYTNKWKSNEELE